ncbi:MAG: hypothetical protein QOE90_2980 [Thermoplasmata archaeon]|nr:hypothetical protein [Thermoplasmata archaeon]
MEKESLRLDAARAYVQGDSSEPVLLSAFRGVTLEDRTRLISSHRRELEAIDAPRLTILESMLLPFEQRAR